MKGKSFNAGDRVLMTTRSGEEQIGQIVHDNGNGTMKILWEKSEIFLEFSWVQTPENIRKYLRKEVEGELQPAHGEG